MFKNILKRKPKTVEIFSPLNGKVIDISDVPDPVFSEKMMGDGFAIIPSDGKLVSPVKGTIIQVFPTKHAICIEAIDGLEIIIHIGLDTVELNGSGFDVKVKVNDSVDVGDLLVNIDIDFLKINNKDTVTPVVISNYADKVKSMTLEKNSKDVKCKELVLKCNLI
ncbi:PTS system glucose-specific IIA component [Clostridium saccharoperbutylacetonicum]|uniref:PTS system glucose-specific EIICBA component PtsG n=1 Tax=Clostridium saccharoperbutylacetonicum N1-4(HMT) TaxID=931276 RepID=M1MC71_9CLOT|nr:PTS glucose transporter subunit IIA [Clostridium saccharoperbutylacetonicum]AGF55524.1 PTS system glucose-specific EIICBA component PtsG [Clostridium saccharoperbutylacetonicum N1-4(HMT)]NRT63757.1 PTS system glucose-specific IIA component [Clostridium saccharoperbutylacetonicum]NSB27120.1 PTS system glucose-specific IIA component [Clostridium saccharoperbutylacetonicum]NSB40606.1 PTS system glucose-specific IIA component [Clostridium saccharoperbutylacetonicum]